MSGDGDRVQAAVVWLRGQCDLDEEAARAATAGPWSADPTGTVCADSDLRPDGRGGEVLPSDGPMEVAECYREVRSGERAANAAHIARQDPGRALREVTAKRDRLRRHAPTSSPNWPAMCGRCECVWPCPDVTADMGVYSGEPGFRLEWLPRW